MKTNTFLDFQIFEWFLITLLLITNDKYIQFIGILFLIEKTRRFFQILEEQEEYEKIEEMEDVANLTYAYEKIIKITEEILKIRNFLDINLAQEFQKAKNQMDEVEALLKVDPEIRNKLRNEFDFLAEKQRQIARKLINADVYRKSNINNIKEEVEQKLKEYKEILNSI